MKHKKANKAFLALGALATVSSLSGVLNNGAVYAADSAAKQAGFGNEALYSCVLTAAGAASGTVLTPSQLAAIKTLTCKGKGITSVAGIEKLTGLESLDLSENEIEDEFSTSTLTALKKLVLTENVISDIDVSKSVDLEELVLDDNSINEIDFSKNVNLKKLSVGNNGIDVLDVTKNTKLEQLSATEMSPDIFLPSGSLITKLEASDEARVHTGIKAVANGSAYTYDLSPLKFLNVNDIVPAEAGAYTVDKASSKLTVTKFETDNVEVSAADGTGYYLVIADTFGFNYVDEEDEVETALLDTCFSPNGVLKCLTEITEDDPTREGYTFLGWSLKKGDTKASYKKGTKVNLYADQAVLTSEYGTVLYAVWQKNGTSNNETPAPSQQNNSKKAANVVNPNTGDDSMSALAAGLALGAVAVPGFFIAKRRR